MASTYSTNLKIELQATGENSGTWGTITNTNLGTALEQAIVGYGNPNYTSDANLTLTYTDTNAAQAARALVLNVTSSLSLTATRELVVPTIQKQYIVQNNTTGSQSITVKTSAGTGITVSSGRKAHLYVDGTNVIFMDDFVDINGGTIDGTPIGGSTAAAGSFTTLTSSSTVTMNGGTANGVLFLNGSKVATSGSALTYNGTTATFVNNASPSSVLFSRTSATARDWALGIDGDGGFRLTDGVSGAVTFSALPSGITFLASQSELVFKYNNTTEGMRLTSTGLGIGTSNPSLPVDVSTGTAVGFSGTGYRVARFHSTAAVNADQPGIVLGYDSAGAGIIAADTQSTGQPIAFWTYNGFAWAEKARITAAGNLGIGTSSPVSKLQVVQTAASEGLRIDGDSGGYALVVNGGTDRTSRIRALSIGAGYLSTTPPTNGLIVDGNVGIGTSSPGQKLEVAGNIFVNTSGNPYAEIKTSGAGNNPYLKLTADTNNWIVQGTFSNANDELMFQYNSSTLMALTKDGNLGVGTTSPLSRVDVRAEAGELGRFAISNAGVGYLLIGGGASTTEGLRLSYNNSEGSSNINNFFNAHLAFSTNNTERARITSGGAVGINRTNPNAFAQLSVSFNPTATLVNNGVGLSVDTTTNTTNAVFAQWVNENGNGIGSVTRVAQTNAVAYNTTSDRRLKENIFPADDAGSVIDAIEIVKHDWKEGGHVRYGVVAQDLHEVAPEAVSPGDPDDVEKLKRSWGVDYSKLVPMLIKEVQSLRKRVAELETK